MTVPPPYRHLSTEIATSFKLVPLTTKTEAVTWLNNRIHSSTTKLRPPAPSPTLLSTHSVKVKVAQLCPTLCNLMDYTVHGILQARIQEWVAFPFSRGSSQPKDRTQVSWLQVDSLPAEPQGKSKNTEWVAYSFSSGSSQPRNWTGVSCIASGPTKQRGKPWQLRNSLFTF